MLELLDWSQWSAWHWLVLALVLGVAEILLPATVIIWFALGAGLTSAVMVVLPELSLLGQALVFGVASVLGLVIGRRLLTRDSGPASTLNQGARAMLGKQAVVSEAIRDGRGAVRIGDSRWAASGPDLDEGAAVRIVNVRSSVVEVQAVQTDPG